MTIVTGILDLGRGAIDGWGRRKYAFYTTNLVLLMRRYRNTPMIVHVRPQDEAMVWRSRNANNTRVVDVTLDTLRTMPYSSRVDAICTSARWVEHTPWLCDSPQRELEGYLPFVLAKPFWLRDAAVINPFGTQCFLSGWTAGYPEITPMRI